MSEDTFSTQIPGAEIQLQALKANDAQALRQLYQVSYFKIEKMVLENNGTREDAKDICQEAFVATWRNIQLEKFTPKNSNAVEAYLYQVARNKWIDHLRSAGYKKTTFIHENSLEEIPAEEINDEDIRYINQVKTTFQQLGENCKEVLSRFYYKKQSLKTIASALGWTDATARNNKYRCIERLRELMKNNK